MIEKEIETAEIAEKRRIEKENETVEEKRIEKEIENMNGIAAEIGRETTTETGPEIKIGTSEIGIANTTDVVATGTIRATIHRRVERPV